VRGATVLYYSANNGTVPRNLFEGPILHYIYSNMSTRTERFQREPRESQDKKNEVVAESDEVVRFSPEEEAVSLHVPTLAPSPDLCSPY
jgi:hypothetical protein